MGGTKSRRGKPRRTRPEAADVKAAILAGHAKKKANPNAFKRAARYTLVRTQRRSFEWQRGFSSIDGTPIRRLNKIGDTLTGIIGEPGTEVWSEGTYPILLDDRTLVRLPANQLLRKAVKLADCLHLRVTITYLGKDYSQPGGHYRKVFKVDPAPLGKDGVGPDGAAILQKAMAEAHAGRAARDAKPRG